MATRLTELLCLLASRAIFTLRVLLMAFWVLVGLGAPFALYFILLGGPSHPAEREVFKGFLWCFGSVSSCVVFIRTEKRYQLARRGREFRSEVSLGLAPTLVSLLWVPFHYL